MKEKYIRDIEEIKDIMDRSTRFITLSGLSGVSTGIVALVGASIAYLLVFKDQEYLVYNAIDFNTGHLLLLFLIAMGTLIVSIVNALFYTHRTTKKRHQRVWDKQSSRLLINLSIPLITGGLLCLMLLMKGFVGLLPPLTLIFYGLALVNGSKFTFMEIRYLGIIEIVIGLIAFQFIDYGLLFWALGFGVVQMVYGFIVQKKYKQ